MIRLAARGRSAVGTKNRVQPPIFMSTLIENTALTSHENRLAVPIFRRTHLYNGLLWAAVVFVLVAVLAPALAAADRKPPPWEKPIQVGRYLYLQNCSVCHEINKAETKKLGPSLFRLFQNEKLPFSGGKPSVEYVRIKTQFGGDVMPPFVNKLSADQINKIIAYIQTKK